MQLVEAPLEGAPEGAAPEQAEEQALRLLREVAVLALEGTARGAGDDMIRQI